MSTPPAQRSLLDRYLIAIPYVVATIAVLSLLFWEAAMRRSPTIFTDELEWTQLSRAIAATGHAARRGHAFDYKSLYAYVIAPGWWIHSTSSAYAAIKYLNTVVMALTAVPVYLLARTMVSSRAAFIAALASLCTTALYYAGFLIPEVLAYPTFALCAYVSIRALAGAGRRWIAAAVVLDLLAPQVRGELVTLPAAFAVAAVVLLVVGPRGQRVRRDWRWFEYAGATLLLIGGLIVANQLVTPHAHEWAVVSANWKGRIWSLGMQATSALALGLGLLPFVGGLASLWIPERRTDPAWRAFAAFAGSALLTVWMYTAVKAAYLSTVFATRVEERNMIYLGPLLIVGTAVWLSSRRRALPGALVALAFTAWLVLHYGYQLDYPYFEAPGYGIAAMANRSWHWTQHEMRIGLAVSCALLLAVLALTTLQRIPATVQRLTLVLALALTAAWMVTAELTSSRGSVAASRAFTGNLAKPLDWVDQATGNAGTTFVGQNIDSGQALGVNLLEFWNRSVKNIWSLDGSAPGPGPTLTPDLVDRYGTLSHDPGLPYVISTDRVNMIGQVVEQHPGLTLRRTSHPWRLHEASYGVSDDGWISGPPKGTEADGTYAYFGPETTTGRLTVDVGRKGFCTTGAPGTHVIVKAGPLALNEQRAPYVARAARTLRFFLANCGQRSFTVAIAPPLAVQVHVSPTVQPTDYGGSDNRELGAQVGFSFAAGK